MLAQLAISLWKQPLRTLDIIFAQPIWSHIVFKPVQQVYFIITFILTRKRLSTRICSQAISPSTAKLFSLLSKQKLISKVTVGQSNLANYRVLERITNTYDNLVERAATECTVNYDSGNGSHWNLLQRVHLNNFSSGIT